MSDDWVNRGWGEISELNYGKAVPKDCSCTVHEVPVLGTSGVFGKTCKPLATGPKVIVGRKGTLGVQLARSDFWTVDTAFWLDESELLDPTWAYYRLRLIDFKKENSGSAVPSFTREHFYSMRLDLPPLGVQRAIAAVLESIDDHVVVNRALAESLKMWSTHTFHTSIQSCSITRTVGDIATFENNKRIPLSAGERLANPGPYPYYGATGQMDSIGGWLFEGPRVLVGEDGSVARPDGTPFVQYVDGQYWVNNHAHVLTGAGISTAMLRVALDCLNVAPVVTGAVQPKLSMGNLKSVGLQLPGNESVDQAIQIAADAELELLAEAAHLVKVRDELLPLLMSGRLRVSELYK